MKEPEARNQLSHYIFMYRRMAALSIRSQWRYRKSLLLSIAAQFLIIGVEFLGLFLLFQRFNNFQGWTLPQMAFLYGTVNIAFAIADALAYGFDQMGPLLKTGNFDRLLVRPLPAVLQLLGMEITIRRSGRIFLGLATFSWAAWRLGAATVLAPASLLLLALAMLAGVLVFLSLFLVQAAFTFVTIEGLEFMNAFTYGGQQTASYPLSAYRKFMQVLFVAFIPIGSCIYLPVCLVLQKSGLPGLPDWAHVAGPLAALPFMAAALLAWRSGQRWYSSSGG
ncbi:MAG: ABC-2 family transporter protein [Spirochaetes bacterium]|nr:ABC-2 family transporter protein [Spirochaetota bacterium]MBU0953913.1 ABC-2 family transporter protein [Spirochaetota bacterium]